jgi:hypothetical protein
MSSTQSNLSLTFEYELTTIIIIYVCTMMIKSNTNIGIVVIVGLLVGLVSILILNFLLPKLNSIAFSVYQYLTLSGMTSFYSSGYMHVWPPILIVFVVFLILIFNSPNKIIRMYTK